MNDETKSINAIRVAMEVMNLDLSDKPSYQVRADIVNNLADHLYGDINVTFNSNWYSGDGLFLQCDDAIKGYGITHTDFRPRWQEFEWNANEKTLTIKGSNYNFSLGFS